jgi:C4-dicarboxylate transporter/malic acid transport protein
MTDRSIALQHPAPAPTRPLQLLCALDSPAEALAHLGPNWFAAVMGTGIVAVAATLLPAHFTGARQLAIAAWLLAAALLAVLLGATAAHWIRYPQTARSHARDPAMAPFYGAPPMAMLTVGAGALLVGRHVIGTHDALVLDWVLWIAGTMTGLAAAVSVRYLMFTAHQLKLSDTLGSWLMPVVPPMVSAATGAALIARLPAGQLRLDMLLACYAMFGLSLFASLVVITLLWGRLTQHGPGPARTIPTLWIVLGPLGQSITAANLLGAQAHRDLPAPYAGALQAMGVLYGVPVLGFALLWLAIAVTIKTARGGLPFSLTWWSFTFPVGTTVTGVSELALHTGSRALTGLSVAMFALLLSAWVTPLVNTARGTATGRLLLAPTAPAISAPVTSPHLSELMSRL